MCAEAVKEYSRNMFYVGHIDMHGLRANFEKLQIMESELKSAWNALSARVTSAYVTGNSF